jgi:hypothetical protein
MCISWFKPKPISWEHCTKVALLFAINAYGGGNELRGCINDVELAETKLVPEGFQIRKFLDDKVTRKRVLAEMEYVIAQSIPGDIIYIHYSGHGTLVKDRNGDEEDGYDEAWYVYDGSIIDDQLYDLLMKIPDGVTVVIIADCCHSGSSTRGDACKRRNRFVHPAFEINSDLQVRNLTHTAIKWVSLAACKDDQSAADAMINGKYHGAFSYYALNTLRRTYTYMDWYSTIRNYLPNSYFDQEPVLEGKESLINQIVLF